LPIAPQTAAAMHTFGLQAPFDKLRMTKTFGNS